MEQPLDRGLNAAILQVTNRLFPTGYDVAPDAPSTFKGLCAWLDAGNRMVVYDGGSEGTVYADAEVNYAMRAWHDWCHWRGRNNFSVEGEAANCAMQQEQLRALYGDGPTTQRWCAILDAEINGQRIYYARHGRYLTDQRSFVLHYLSDPEAALSATY